MKTGFHFNADDESLGTFYGAAIEEKFFSALASVANLSLSTIMYVGDLSLNSFAMECSGTETVKVYSFNEEKYADGFAGWLAAALLGWARFPTCTRLDVMRTTSSFSRCPSRVCGGAGCCPAAGRSSASVSARAGGGCFFIKRSGFWLAPDGGGAGSRRGGQESYPTSAPAARKKRGEAS